MNQQERNMVAVAKQRRRDLIEELERVDAFLAIYNVSTTRSSPRQKAQGNMVKNGRLLLQILFDHGLPMSARDIGSTHAMPTIKTDGGVRYVLKYLEEEGLVTETTGNNKYKKWAPTPKAIEAYTDPRNGSQS